MSKKDKERAEKYQAECDLKAIQEADEVRGDPKRLAAVKKLAQEQAEALTLVIGPDGREPSDEDKGARGAVDEALDEDE